MSSRRVLFVAPSAYPLGGVAVWLDYLLPGLAARGWDPTLGLTQGYWHDVGKYRRAMPQGNAVTIANLTGSHEGRVRALAATIRHVAPALVAGVNIPDSYAAVARLRGEGKTAPRAVMTLHGIQPDLYEDVLGFRTVLDGVVCSNRLACRMSEAQGIDATRVHYAPYGVDLPPLIPSVPRAPGPLRLAFVGRLEEWQKRLADLAEIASELARRGVDFELSIAGAGPDEAALAARLRGHPASNRIRFLGNLTSDDVAQHVYRQCDILLLTSLWETGPLVVWEAMAHGLAIVSSRYIGSGLEDGLHDGDNCLLFPVGQVAAAADCVVRLQDPGLRARLSTGARALVEKRYSRSRSIDAWSRSFESVMAAAPLTGMPDAIQVEPAGRLDRWCGTRLAEAIRRAARLRFRHQSPGGEWPHSYGRRSMDDPVFWQEASMIDLRMQ
jgi:glycosyltransferase involved in cell wall biosynthesis